MDEDGGGILKKAFTYWWMRKGNKMALIPKIIIWLVKLEEKRIATIYGQKPKNIYCHRNEKGEVVGLLFKNIDEQFDGMHITTV